MRPGRGLALALLLATVVAAALVRVLAADYPIESSVSAQSVLQSRPGMSFSVIGATVSSLLQSRPGMSFSVIGAQAQSVLQSRPGMSFSARVSAQSVLRSDPARFPAVLGATESLRSGATVSATLSASEGVREGLSSAALVGASEVVRSGETPRATLRASERLEVVPVATTHNWPQAEVPTIAKINPLSDTLRDNPLLLLSVYLLFLVPLVRRFGIGVGLTAASVACLGISLAIGSLSAVALFLVLAVVGLILLRRA